MSYGVPLLIFSISNTFSFLIAPSITTFQASRRSLFGSIILLSSLLLSWPIIIITTIIMEDNGGIKLTGIKQIVRLKELLQKWQSVALSPKGGVVGGGSHHQDDHHHHQKSHHLRCLSDPLQRGGISPAISRRLMGASAYCDSDEESSCQSPEPPHGVPKGYLAVYVGPELRRFIIPTSYLTEPVFKVLLEKVEEEFGFDHSGGLTIPCEIETFKYLLNYLETHQNATDYHHRNSNHSAPAGTSVAVEE